MVDRHRVIRELKAFVVSLGQAQQFFHWQNYNEMDSVTVSGLRNHRDEGVIAVFQWLADNAPGSYGLLYVQDDEDSRDDWQHIDNFRVFRLARGRLEEGDDPFLSPYIPTVEDPYDPALEGGL